MNQLSVRGAAVCLVLCSLACGSGQTSQGISFGGSGGAGSVSPTLVEGDPNPAPVFVPFQNGSGCDASYTASAVTVEDARWLSVSPEGGTIAVNQTVQLVLFFSTSLPPGNHAGTVTVTGTCINSGRVATGSPAVISVNLRVKAASGLSVPGNVAVDGVTLANEWSPLLAGTDPQAEHQAIWTGNAVAVYGGIGTFGTAAGAMFDPRTGGWQQVSTSRIGPFPRSHGAVVWSGSRLIVFGGDSFGTALGDGGEYDPATDSWSFLSGNAFYAPSSRAGPAAVWAAGRMLVFGGRNGSSYFGDGAAYMPGSGWTQIMGSPLAVRAFPISVWTGRRMLVWGGIAGDGITMLPGGGQYDPVSDTWSPMSSTNTPSLGAASAWTGSHLLVWGGAAPGAIPVNTGARFDGVRNAWSPMSTVGAPSARQGVAGAWTGSRFVVFGGRGADGTVLSDGGIYDPQTDIWAPLSAVAAPGPRWHHSATWTGSELVFFGGNGQDGFNFFADGGVLR